MSEPVRIVIDTDRALRSAVVWWQATQDLLEELRRQKKAREAADNSSPGEAESSHVGPGPVSAQ